MREDLLHYIWRYGKYPKHDLKSSKGEKIAVLNSGTYNELSGPDFFNAQIRIGNQLWAGNVEIHINSSDWYAHRHEEDANYANVILHVVWNDDVSVFSNNDTEIPTLELKHYIEPGLLETYRELMTEKAKGFINCDKDISTIREIDFKNWLDRLFIERLEEKSKVILNLLEQSNNDWEKVLFIMLLKNFGSKINGEAFFQVGKQLDFSIVRHLVGKPLELESLLFGLAGLLESNEIGDSYYLELQKSFQYLSHKYGIDRQYKIRASFFKLRPANFPTIRLSQVAKLYSSTNNLFSQLMQCEGDEIYKLFHLSASEYWENHYSFGKVSRKTKKVLTRKTIELLIINTILPLQFCYQRYKGNIQEDLSFSIINGIKEEKNGIIENFKKLNVEINSAKDSQSVLQLHNNYCTRNKCLQCAVGTRLLNLKS